MLLAAASGLLVRMLAGAGASGLRSKARKDRGGNTVIEQDKSGAGGAHSKIRVPTLDFNILHSNQEQEMNQEEQPLDEDQQEL